MTPLARISIFAAGATIWASIAAAWVFVSPWVGLAAAAGGIGSALVATLERVPRATTAESDAERPTRDDETFRLRRRDRAEITRAARAAADDDD